MSAAVVAILTLLTPIVIGWVIQKNRDARSSLAQHVEHVRKNIEMLLKMSIDYHSDPRDAKLELMLDWQRNSVINQLKLIPNYFDNHRISCLKPLKKDDLKIDDMLLVKLNRSITENNWKSEHADKGLEINSPQFDILYAAHAAIAERLYKLQQKTNS